MSHANETKTSFTHDPPPRYRSSSSTTNTQYPPAMGKGILDHDTQIYQFKKYRQVWASGPAAIVAVLAGSPMENVKTRMQSRHFSSAWATTKYIYRYEGIRGFWMGTTAPLLSIVPSRVANFVIYRRAKYEIDRVIESATGQSPLQWVNTAGTYPNAGTLMCFTASGMLSGAILTPFLTPFELLKNASQTSILMSTKDPIPHKSGEAGRRAANNANRVGTIAAAKKIVQTRGVGALFTGMRLHLLRDVVGGGVYFGVYESVKQALGSYYGDEIKNTPWAIPMAGFLCGVASWVVTYPLDTMKTRAQNQLLIAPTPKQATSSALDSAAKAASRVGRWRGLEMAILRSAVQNMIQMTAFEHVKVLIDNAKFSNGRTSLPKIKREKGRDQKII